MEKFSVNPPNVYGFGHQAYYEHVVDCLTNGAPALVDGLEGRKSLELITALYESIETGERSAAAFPAAALPARGSHRERRPRRCMQAARCATSRSASGSRSSSPATSTGARSATTVFVGPFAEIQKGVAHRRAHPGAVACLHLRAGDDRRGLLRRPRRDVHQRHLRDRRPGARRARSLWQRPPDRQPRLDRLQRHHPAGHGSATTS